MRKRWAVLGFALLLGVALAWMPTPAAAELKVSVSGYVKLDMQWSDKIADNGFVGGEPSTPPSGVPYSGDKVHDHDQFIIDAKQTRFRINASDEVSGVKLASSVEGDFFQADGSATTSNSRHLRLRQAWARAEHPSGFFMLAGQTWSNFMNTDVASPDTVDFNGPAGQAFARQPQLRFGWKLPGVMGGDILVATSVEKASTNNLGSTAVAENQGEGQDTPVHTLRAGYYGKLFLLEVAGAYNNAKVITTAGNKLSQPTWALQSSVQVDIGPASLYGHYQWTQGLARIFNADYPSVVLITPPGQPAGTGSLAAIRVQGFYAGGQYRLLPELSFNAVYGWAQALNSGDIAGFNDGTPLSCASQFSISANAVKCQRTQQSVHANVMYKFWQRWQAGLEYRYEWVASFNNPHQDGHANFVHGALWFFF